MALRVEPARLPLPGGSPGATLVLHPLCCAEVPMPVGWARREAGPRGALRALGIGAEGPALQAPIVAFLLEHPTAGAVLVDTGVRADATTSPLRTLGPINALIFRGTRMREEGTIARQLAARGVAPGELALVVMTHLHVDHAGALGDFPGASVLVTQPEWAAATGRRGALAGYHRPQLDERLAYRLLPFPSSPAAGLARLDQALDVFGDGSLRLLPTPGHTPGHQSALVRLRDRQALLTGDAVYTMATLRDGDRPFLSVDADAFEASVEALAAVDAAHPGTLVVPGHDMAVWSGLDARYA